MQNVNLLSKKHARRGCYINLSKLFKLMNACWVNASSSMPNYISSHVVSAISKFA